MGDPTAIAPPHADVILLTERRSTAAGGVPPAYGRVDEVHLDVGSPAVMEPELVEPVSRRTRGGETVSTDAA